MSRYSPDVLDDFEEEDTTPLESLRKTLWDPSDALILEQPKLIDFHEETRKCKVNSTLTISPEIKPKADSETSKKLLNVQLRIRPPSTKERAIQAGQPPIFSLLNDKELILIPPQLSQTFKVKGNTLCRYMFSRIHKPDTNQEEFFQSTALPLVADLLKGKDALLFTYGVTNAGKTFTIQGVPRDTGILPRSLDVIFNSIKISQSVPSRFKPYCFKNAVSMSKEDYNSNISIKNEVIAWDSEYLLQQKNPDLYKPTDDSMSQETSSVNGNDTYIESEFDRELEGLPCGDRIEESAAVPIASNTEYSVFVSCTEVYNECVYDLLVPPPTRRGKANGKVAARSSCRLGERDGDTYIRGIREIQVLDSAEALKIMCAGQRNRKVAATRSNHESSRSHCLFTIKVISKATHEKKVNVSQFTIVDLAGSERYKKTKAGSERVKEAGTINTSLMTLGKCIEVLKWNQEHQSKQQRIVPYRDSKLTRLFKYFLDGKGNLLMIVNIANVHNSFDETTHALKFSALARKVGATSLVSKFRTLDKDKLGRDQEYTNVLVGHKLYSDSLLEQLREVQEQLAEAQMKSVKIEAVIREEVAEEMARELAKLEEQYRNTMAAQSTATEMRYLKKWNILSRSVARLPTKSQIDECGHGLQGMKANLVASIDEVSINKGKFELSEKNTYALFTYIRDLEDSAAQDAVRISDLTKQITRLGTKARRMSQTSPILQHTETEKSIQLNNSQRDAQNQTSQNTKLNETEIAESCSRSTEMETRPNVLANDRKCTQETRRKCVDELYESQNLQQPETNIAYDILRQSFDESLEELENRYSPIVMKHRSKSQSSGTNCKIHEELQELYDKNNQLRISFTKIKQQNALSIATLNRKLKAKEETIKVLETAVKSEEEKNNKLNTQLAKYLGEQMRSEVVQFATTPVGASVNGSILVRDKSKMIEIVPQLLETGTEITTPHTGEGKKSIKFDLAKGNNDNVELMKADNSDTMHTSSSVFRSTSTLYTHSASSTVDLPLATKPINTRLRAYIARPKRMKTKPTDDEANTSILAAKNRQKTLRKRKLYQRSEVENLDVTQTSKPKKSKANTLLTPIKRRLRSRNKLTADI